MKAIELLNSRASVLLLETNSTKNIQRMYLEKSLTPEDKEQYFIKIYSLKSAV